MQKKTQGAFFSITNKGKYAASDIEYCAVFYKGGKIAYMTSNDCGSLNPNNTQNIALNTLMPYDQIKVYVHGLRA